MRWFIPTLLTMVSLFTTMIAPCPSFATVSDQDVITFLQNKQVTASAETLTTVLAQNSTISEGTPWLNIFKFLLDSARVVQDLRSADYSSVIQAAADAAANLALGGTIVGDALLDASSLANCAVLPLQISIDYLAQASNQAAINFQIKLYFSARDMGYSYDDIINQRSSSADIIYANSGGWWLQCVNYSCPDALAKYPVNLTPEVVFSAAENMYQAYLASAYYERNITTAINALQNVISPSIITTPTNSSAPVQINLSIAGAQLNEWNVTIYQWNFGDGSTGSGQTANHFYKNPGTYSVVATLTGSDGTNHVVTQPVIVQPPSININYPNGYESLQRNFSTPKPSCISGYPCVTGYTWNYGDSSPVDSGASTSHTYSASGAYTVNLNLALDDGSNINSSLPIFVGPGTRYIQGHTVYGQETWYSGGTYVIQENITVAQGATLTIQPGTIVELSGGVAIYVSGTLNATGVTFNWADGKNQWTGISFYGAGANASSLKNCTILNASGGFNINANYIGIISISGASPTITGCTINNTNIQQLTTGIWLDNTSATITNNSINGMNFIGINFALSISNPIVTGNTFSNNATGIALNYPNNNPVLSYNTYSGNTVDINVSGTINGTVNWDGTSPTGTYYVSSSLSIASGAALNISQGNIIKLARGVAIYVSGTLNATGVTFNWADGKNQWTGISFYGAGANASSLKNCTILNASGGFNINANYIGIISISGASPTITGCTINNTNIQQLTTGIWLDNTSATITNNSINGMNFIGINVGSSSNPIVNGNTISNNATGIQIDSSSLGAYHENSMSGNSSYGLVYSGNAIISATNNNWGDPSGPLDNSDDRATGGLYNPNGKGNKVSDHVNYYPWVGTSITQTSSPTGLSAIPGNATVNLKWNSISNPDLGGYKIYYGTASGTYSNPIIVGNGSSYELTGLTNGSTYYIAMSSMNSIGAESAKSAEITVKPVYDITAPNITTFSITATQGKLAVALSLIATDNIGGTGVADYCMQETSAPAGCTWNSTVPSKYTFSSAGNKTLYAWARDGAGNVSSAASASATITFFDTSAPVITEFTMPATSSSLTVAVSTLTATDDVGVTGYLLTETANQPQADNPAWSTSVPASYKFSSQGVKTLYAFAKDAEGNVSVPLNASVAITLADITPPTVTAFTMPITSSSLTVAVSTLTATDDVGVTGYLLTETANQPQADNPAWATSVPASYKFSNQGVKTLYAFAKDAAGNVSVPLNASVAITLSDITPPTVTAFTIPTTSSSLTVAVSTLTATDDVGVTGYLLTETASQPQSDNPAWTASVPALYTFTTQGVNTLYAFAKDAAGNVSVPLNASVAITLSDITPPTVTAFTIPTTSSSLTVAVSTLTATDDVGVTGYLLTESAAIPQVNNPAWTSTPTNSYTFVNSGGKTLFAFAKDAAGNVSASLSANVTISLPDTTPPVVAGFTVPTSSTSLTIQITTFSATDNTAVTGYLVTESTTAPQATNTDWTSVPLTSYTFSSAGSKTFYAYAKDAAGNVSSPILATTTVTLPDTIAPTVTAFVIPATSNSLTVPVTTFTATDNIAVTGYVLYESAILPQGDNLPWNPLPPNTYFFSTTGSKTLYAFAKDAAGNISPPASASIDITNSVDGACGPSNGQSFITAPSTNLCTTGNASSVTGSGPWNWSCNGSNGGTAAGCNAQLQVNGTCGSSNGANLTTAPATNLCTTGNASSVTGSGPWNWSCNGSNGGTAAGCNAQLQVNGTCGSSNGANLTTAPATNLCTTGNASSVTGSGPWNWSCNGSNGGTACSANIQNYSLTFSAGTGGSILGTTPQTISYGGSSTAVMAQPAAGYTFVNWTGDNGFVSTTANSLTVTNDTSVHHIIANFIGVPALTPSIPTKSGTLKAAVWTIALTNSGTAPATNASITGLKLAQTSGAACTPVIISTFPINLGTISQGDQANGSVNISFTGCATLARFSATTSFSSNAGTITGSNTLSNQYY